LGEAATRVLGLARAAVIEQARDGGGKSRALKIK
jgi:hypothetical protein